MTGLSGYIRRGEEHMKQDDLVKYIDGFLRTSEIPDKAVNGLQVEGTGDIKTIAAAVDASVESFERASELGAQMLIVHHGILFGDAEPITGRNYRRLKILIDHGLSLYASHLPLDMHPEIGNNAEIARILSVHERVPFGDYHGTVIGCGGTLAKPSDPRTLASILSAATGSVCTTHVNNPVASRIAIVSGGGTFALDEAACSGYDTLVTGETKHLSYHAAKEYGVSVIFGGHYGTETLGVRALAAHLSEKFGLAPHFIDLPTGM
jgi:dinuclear metal center YbgI/SA1388 family protein